MNIYQRQSLFPPIGKPGQERLRGATVFLAGCGAVGSQIASHLVRAGVGRLVFADRDIVEITDLQRQCLFDRDDAARGIPKVEAAARRLARINPDVVLEPHAVDLGPGNLLDLAAGADLIADGADNFLLRLTLNDAALKLGIPWIYTGVIAGIGHGLTIPEKGRPCLRCLVGDLPPPGTVATCAQAGVIGPAVGFMASLAAAEGLRILTGHRPANAGRLLVADVWNGRLRRVLLETDPGCPACGAGRYDFLEGRKTPTETVLCGSNFVQIGGGEKGLGSSLEELARALGEAGEVALGPFHLRFSKPPLAMTVFRDGRVIVEGTRDPGRARSFRDKYL